MTTIRCSECNTPIMEVEGREITVKGRHHGKQHVTVVRIEDLEGTMTPNEGAAPIESFSIRRIEAFIARQRENQRMGLGDWSWAERNIKDAQQTLKRKAREAMG